MSAFSASRLWTIVPMVGAASMMFSARTWAPVERARFQTFSVVYIRLEDGTTAKEMSFFRYYWGKKDIG